jgi:ABC-type transport system substrate-binding protein
MLINQALAELDTQKSMELVKQASAVLYEDLPSIPLFHQSMFYISRKDITFPKDKDISFWQTAALRWASRTKVTWRGAWTASHPPEIL